MTSDKERREVAARLRAGHRRDGESQVTFIARMVKESDRVTVVDVLRLPETLADFIDRPTCRNVSGHRDTFECSECRCKLELTAEVCNERGEIFRVPFMPKYCPSCEAEVVEDV